MASILSLFGSTRYHRVTSILKISTAKQCKRGNYFVILPEIPSDTPETNPLLQKNYIPDFTKLSEANYVNAVGKYLLEFESGVCRIEENIESGEVPKSIDDLIKPIEVLSAPLDFTFCSLNAYNKLMKNGDLKDTVSKFHSRVNQSKASRFSSVPIYNTLKEISEEKTLTENQKRLARKYLLESRLSGIELAGYNKGHLENTNKKLTEHKDLYRRKLEVSKSRFKHGIYHSGLIKNFPQALIKKMASNPHRPTQGPWNVTLEPTVTQGFLENCSDRMERWNVWRANVSRASATDSEVNNSIHIEEIRFYRRDLAKLLGYGNYAELSMETKMAGSVDTVKSLITSLHLKTKLVIEKELLDLQEFALENGFNGQLELWDVPFWKNEQKKALYSLDEHELSQYFPLEKVLEGLFRFCKDMFGVEIVDSSKDAEKWHKDVKYYKVYDEQGKFKGSFFSDLFQRPGVKADGSWLDVARSKNEAAGVDPLLYLILNLSSPPSGQKALLTFDDLQHLFKMFGHLLQQIMSEVKYSEVSGLNNMEWDAVAVLPHFMNLWLTDYNTISKISCHVKTSEPLPKSIHDKIKKSRNHMAGYNLNNQLYLSALDLELYTRKDFWLDVMRNVWADYIPFELDKNDAHPCSFRDIFCDFHAASYYSHNWAEMIAADAFGAFYEVGLGNQFEVQQVGRRFKDTFLALGGGCSSSEVFRRFRGRDPSLESLLVSRGLRKLKIPIDD